MASGGQIDQLLQDSRLWQAGRVRAAAGATVPTGWSELDQALGGGWPLGQLTEFLIDTHGVGEFTLLLPGLRMLANQQAQRGALKWVALVAPPYMPYAPALARSGMDVSSLLVIHPRRNMDMLWAMEQVLRSQTCTAVAGWSQSPDEVPLRRLQLAAEVSESWAILFRPAHLRSARSPAPLRIHLTRERVGTRLMLDVLKRRGGPPVRTGVDIGG